MISKRRPTPRGLWAVGVVMVACGTFLGTAFVAGCAVPVRLARRVDA
ncbi:hypothetical protein [Pseudonocardia sp. N23]|nr:hypothetical protein [Pseudonocardia sp. N23]GAY12461.1 hypothetical protein TOK_0857 [Pseudonocardia sp. N23]